MVKGENLIVGYYGWKGSGKTVSLTLFLLIAHLQRLRQRIFCNYKLEFPFEWLAGKDMIELEKTLDNSVIGIDELHEYADSRNSGSLQNKRVSDFFLQSRHFNCDIFYTTQYKDAVDKRIRRITDIDVVCENLFTDLDGDGDDDLFQLTIKDRRMPESAVRQLRYYAKPVFDLYDSTERINPFVFTRKQETDWKKKVSEANEQGRSPVVHTKKDEKKWKETASKKPVHRLINTPALLPA
jgi:hypothetical protein